MRRRSATLSRGSDVTPVGQGYPWPSPTRGWWMIAVLCVAAILSYTDRFILSLLVDPIRADLAISDTKVSLLQGLAFALVYSVAGLPLGRVADIARRRNVILSGVLIWSASTVACGLAQSFGALFLARMGVGIGEAALAPAAVAMIADAFPPERRGMPLSVFIAGMAIGGGAAITIGGSLLGAASKGLFGSLPLIGQLPSWRLTLILLALPGVATGALLLTVSEPVRRDRDIRNALERVRLGAMFEALRKNAAVLAPIYLAVALVSVGDFSFQNWTPALLARRFGLSAADIGAQLGLVAIVSGVSGTLAGGLLGDLVARRGGERARMTLALAAVSIGLLGALIGFARSPLEALVCFGLWTTTASAAETLGITVLQSVIPGEIRGVGNALVSFANMMIGLAGGTTLTAVLTDHVFHDPRSVGKSMGVVLVPAALAALALFSRVRTKCQKLAVSESP
ncbi:MAG: MFS transporter [Steroidobacteraceae bacterium]